MIVLEGLLWFAALVWASAFVRAVRTRSEGESHLGEDSVQAQNGSRVMVIVPARNEEGGIAKCVESVIRQDIPGLGILVLDDGSSDETGAILAKLVSKYDALSVVQGEDGPLPDGWLGKPWACQRAAEAAMGQNPEVEWLLFLDADVTLQPQAVGAAVQEAVEHRVDLLSGLGNLELKGFWERVFQPVVAGLILAGNDLSKINERDWRDGDSPLANGQFLLFRRTSWESLGGHRAVRDNVLDDVGLAQAVISKGFKYRIVYMPSLFSVRMYESLSDMWSGWSKNLFAGLGYRWGRLFWVQWLLCSLVLLPLGAMLAGFCWDLGPRIWAAATVGVACMFFVRSYLDYVFKQDLRFVVTLPLGCMLLVLLLFNSALQTRWGKRSWKGRTIESTGSNPRATIQ